MSENNVPWYKSPSHWGVIIAALALIVSIGVYIHPIPSSPSQPDFSISVDPLLEHADAGEIIQTRVTVKSINSYDYPVVLSLVGLPYTSCFFNPRQATPTYTSTVSIAVPLESDFVEYPLNIKGIGGDGREHSCTYILSVIPR